MSEWRCQKSVPVDVDAADPAGWRQKSANVRHKHHLTLFVKSHKEAGMTLTVRRRHDADSEKET